MSIIRIETPEGPVAVISPVVQRLVSKGILTQDAQGIYHGTSMAEVNKFVLELGVCDFCDATDPKYVIPAPDFDLPGMTGGRSTGGWAACEECNTLIAENKRPELVRRAVERSKVGKFGAATIQALHQEFWNARDQAVLSAGTAAAMIDFINDAIPGYATITTDKDRRAAAIQRMTGLTHDELDAIRRGDMTYKDTSKKLALWYTKYGAPGKDGARKLLDMFASDVHPLVVGAVPHWQQALDAKFKAAEGLAKALNKVGRMEERLVAGFVNPIDLNDKETIRKRAYQAEAIHMAQEMDFRTDVKMLRAAEAFSFNTDTIRAIQAAANSLPHDAPLSSVDVPTGAGWFWFSTPLDLVSSSSASPVTNALLWSWDDSNGGKVAMRFSSYVIDQTQGTLRGEVLPATRWFWPLDMTFHDMLAFNIGKYRQDYGSDGRYGDSTSIAGEQDTMRVIADLSLFFLAACMWFKQRILVSAPGHVERHARKRYVREHKLSDAPSVRVIALRRSERTEQPLEAAASDAEGKTREWSHRWIVSGHPRLQPCGPGRADRKLIWIDPYPKGPDDKPLVTRQKVYAVIR